MATFKLFSNSKSVKPPKQTCPESEGFSKTQKIDKSSHSTWYPNSNSKSNPNQRILNLIHPISTIPIIIWTLEIMSTNLYSQPHIIKDIFEILENWELFIQIELW